MTKNQKWPKSRPPIIIGIALFFTHPTFASEKIHFKEPISSHSGFLSYGICLVLLLMVILFIAKKYRPSIKNASSLKILEKQYLSNKTLIYVIEYQSQQFLLADNQHALSLHPLPQENNDETR